MSKINQLHHEIEALERKFSGNSWLRSEAMLQLIHRENILTGNRLRRKYGESEIIPEAHMYKPINHKKVEWIIDVPQEWISLTGKDSSV